MAWEVLGSFYTSWWPVIDFFIYFIIFLSICMYVFSKNYGKENAVRGMAVAFAIALSAAMLGLEFQYGYTIATMGCIAAIFLILMIVALIVAYFAKENQQYKWWFYIGGFVLAVILVNIFFSFGFCSNSFYSGTGSGGSGGVIGGDSSGAPWWNASGVTVPGGRGWLDWLITLAAIIGIYWLIVQFGGNAGRGGSSGSSGSGSTVNLGNTPGSTAAALQGIMIHRFDPIQGQPGNRYPCTIWGRGLSRATRVQFALHALLGTSASRLFTGIRANIENAIDVGNGNIEARGTLEIDPASTAIAHLTDGVQYDIWVENPDGQRDVLRRGFTIGTYRAAPADSSLQTRLNNLQRLCLEGQNFVRDILLVNVNAQLGHWQNWYTITRADPADPAQFPEWGHITRLEGEIRTNGVNFETTYSGPILHELLALSTERGRMTPIQQQLLDVLNRDYTELVRRRNAIQTARRSREILNISRGTAPVNIGYGTNLTFAL